MFEVVDVRGNVDVGGKGGRKSKRRGAGEREEHVLQVSLSRDRLLSITAKIRTQHLIHHAALAVEKQVERSITFDEKTKKGDLNVGLEKVIRSSGLTAAFRSPPVVLLPSHDHQSVSFSLFFSSIYHHEKRRINLLTNVERSAQVDNAVRHVLDIETWADERRDAHVRRDHHTHGCLITVYPPRSA